MKNVSEIINSITQDWFLSEPFLFACFCTHQLVENNGLHVPFRTGKGRIEYSSEILKTLNKYQISEYLKIEVFRILLKHPYQRQPDDIKKACMTIASDATIYANYQTDVELEGVEYLKEMVIRLTTMKDGMPGFKKNLTQSESFIRRVVESKFLKARREMGYKTFAASHNVDELKTLNPEDSLPDSLEIEHNGKKYKVTLKQTAAGNEISVQDEGGKELSNDNLSKSQRVIKKDLENYLSKRNGIILSKDCEEVEALIDGRHYKFVSEGMNETDYYRILVMNENSGNYLPQFSSDHAFWTGIADYDHEGNFRLSRQVCYEEYCSRIRAMLEFTESEGSEKIKDGTQDSSDKEKPDSPRNRQENLDKLSEQSELWEDDEETRTKIDNVIDDAEKAQKWGSVSGDMKDVIKANRKVQMNYSELLRHFSTSILSTRRALTRMKPNRRFGFGRLGSKYRLTSNLLVAVDISSSITEENLEYVFSVINRFFRYGVERIDVIQFDTEIEGGVMVMEKAMENIKLHGRGGTDFQPAADFYSKHTEYDGLIYFTDGYGPHPEFKRKDVDVLWIFTSKEYYDSNAKWADKIPGCMSTWIPLPFGGYL